TAKEVCGVSVESWLEQARACDASDLHIVVGAPPTVRRFGVLKPLTALAVTAEQAQAVAFALLSANEWAQLRGCAEVETGRVSEVGGRLRITATRQRDQFSLAIRLLGSRVPSLSELGLPDAVCGLARVRRGLIVVAGATGCGKSTTLAALVAAIGRERAARVICLEDPIEYWHEHGRGTVEQREVGRDTDSFASGLRTALRQDPDVIAIGELRDADVVDLALRAAESGHLALATLHAVDTSAAITRLIECGGLVSGSDVRARLAAVLRAVVAQQLWPRADGSGLALAAEVLLATEAVSNVIRSDQRQQLRSLLQTGRAVGMQTFSWSVQRLVSAGVVEPPADIIDPLAP
ncbi:MAG: PilT/PilU family type 4a pilus ATPase, partial [Firmicutes bacterium]|nr:PilT/PilU family type 4a pilus ATPase [Bacillota bacterium]